MSREEIREFFYKEGLIHFDETACGKFSLERDLDEENWSQFQRRAKISAELERVEKIGSGIRRIRDLCRDHSVAEPLNKVSENWVTTTFARQVEHAEERGT